jgi:hypothetical protein
LLSGKETFLSYSNPHVNIFHFPQQPIITLRCVVYNKKSIVTIFVITHYIEMTRDGSSLAQCLLADGGQNYNTRIETRARSQYYYMRCSHLDGAEESCCAKPRDVHIESCLHVIKADDSLRACMLAEMAQLKSSWLDRKYVTFTYGRCHCEGSEK